MPLPSARTASVEERAAGLASRLRNSACAVVDSERRITGLSPPAAGLAVPIPLCPATPCPATPCPAIPLCRSDGLPIPEPPAPDGRAPPRTLAGIGGPPAAGLGSAGRTL